MHNLHNLNFGASGSRRAGTSGLQSPLQLSNNSISLNNKAISPCIHPLLSQQIQTNLILLTLTEHQLTLTEHQLTLLWPEKPRKQLQQVTGFTLLRRPIASISQTHMPSSCTPLNSLH
jgi:hypothetical protein